MLKSVGNSRLGVLSGTMVLAVSLLAAQPAQAGAGQPGHHHGESRMGSGQHMGGHHKGGEHMPGHHQMPDGTMMKGDKHMDGHHGPNHHGRGPEVGHPGKASDVTRTITVTLQDIYFEPETISLKAGETVRFKIVNKGALLHEFALGTPASHEAHKKMMEMMQEHGMIEADRINPERMNMHHGPGEGHMNHMHGPESGSVLVEPGKSAEMIWTFPKAMKLEFACTIPGHYEAGMVGPLTVQ